MDYVLAVLRIHSESDVVTARTLARRASALLGCSASDQTRIATAVSEIARHAFMRAGKAQGAMGVAIDADGPYFTVKVGESAKEAVPARPADVDTPSSDSEDIIGYTRRLVDRLEVAVRPDVGTIVTLAKKLPRDAGDPAAMAAIARELSDGASANTYEEMLAQNKELLETLVELRTRQEELVSLTNELEDTNRGVVALYAEIEEKSEHLRRADEMKSRFLSNTSHELRTPLSSIRALCNLLLERVDGELTDPQEMQVRFILKAANDLSDMVNDLLDLAKIEAGKVMVEPAVFSVADLFSSLRGMLRPLSVGSAVELVFDDSRVRQALYTDEGKVSQILRNFISNALKFTENGEVRVDAVDNPDTGTIDFRVSDTGIGIAESNLQLIFEEFSQIENPLQKRSKGTGLGLPLCKKLATLLGGSIAVQSRPGAGSCFTLTIPATHGSVADTTAGAGN
jgi:signal transduction histidine kinase